MESQEPILDEEAAEEGDAPAAETAETAEPAAEPAPPEPGEAERRAQEYLQTLQRLQADFNNFRRRVNQDQTRWADAAVAAFIMQLLPVLDNLERALASDGDAKAWRQGVELTVREFGEVLAGAGVTPMASTGQPFDPTRHEAVAHGPEPGVAAGVVAAEYRRGYVLRDQVLRPAMVRVSDGTAASPAAPESAPAGSEPLAPEGSPPDPAAKEGER